MPAPTEQEIKKLNDLLEGGLKGKPDSFWLEDDIDGQWWFSLRVELDTEGGEEPQYLLAWYNTLYEGEGSKLGITAEGDDWRDSEFLGNNYAEALKSLQDLVPKLRKQKHIYNG